MKLIIAIIAITVFVFIYYNFVDSTPKSTHCNPLEGYCPSVSSYDSY